MKKLLFLAVAMLLVGAADPAPTVTLTSMFSNPTFNGDGSIATATVQASFQSIIVADDQKFAAQSAVQWDGADQKKTVTVDKITLTYYQVTTFAAAIANQERMAQATAAKAAAASP